MTCNCKKYEYLEPCQHSIYKRIQETQLLRKTLEKVAENKNNSLFKCSFCNQFWQESIARNWGSTKYLFKVPEITLESWIAESFLEPDQLLSYLKSLQEYEEKQIFLERDFECKFEACVENAIRYSVFCKTHHIQMLQDKGVLPKFPKGNFFELDK